MKRKRISIDLDYVGDQPEFRMEVYFDSVGRLLLSIAHRQISNRESGVLRHTGNPLGERIVNGRTLSGAFHESKKDARLYHDKIEEHIEALDFSNDFFLIGNGNLGNNFWNVAWEQDKAPRLYCLKDEPFTTRRYSCLVVPTTGVPRIQDLKFDNLENVLDIERDPLEDVDWATYGQRVVEDGEVVWIGKTYEQFYDVKHVLPLKDHGPTKEQDIEKMKKLYEGYPEDYNGNVAQEMFNIGERLSITPQGIFRDGKSRIPLAEYYHNVLGVNDEKMFVWQATGTPEEIGQRMANKGAKDAIILDNGGSVGFYASWLFPEGGWLNASNYFRSDRISWIGVELKD